MQEKVEIITNHFENFWNYWTKILKNGYCAPPDFQTLRHACVENLSNDADVNDQEK